MLLGGVQAPGLNEQLGGCEIGDGIRGIGCSGALIRLDCFIELALQVQYHRLQLPCPRMPRGSSNDLLDQVHGFGRLGIKISELRLADERLGQCRDDLQGLRERRPSRLMPAGRELRLTTRGEHLREYLALMSGGWDDFLEKARVRSHLEEQADAQPIDPRPGNAQLRRFRKGAISGDEIALRHQDLSQDEMGLGILLVGLNRVRRFDACGVETACGQIACGSFPRIAGRVAGADERRDRNQEARQSQSGRPGMALPDSMFSNSERSQSGPDAPRMDTHDRGREGGLWHNFNTTTSERSHWNSFLIRPR